MKTLPKGIICAAFLFYLLPSLYADSYQLKKIIPPPVPTENLNFGISVSSVGNDILIGDSGHSYLYDVNGLFLRSLNTPNGFGGTVAGVGHSKSLIGSHSSDNVYLFDNLTGDSLYTFSRGLSGSSLDELSLGTLDEDLLIGSPRNDGVGGYPGDVKLFDSTTGQLLHTFVDPSTTPFDRFGWSIASADHDVLIGAVGASHKAYLFDGNTYDLKQTFNSPNPNDSYQFGSSVSLSNGRALIGANQDGTQGSVTGAAYLFDVVTGDLIHSFFDPNGDIYDRFGWQVAFVGDDIAISAFDIHNGGIKTGAVYLYDGLTFDPIQTLLNPTPEMDDYFGNSIASLNGKLIVGASENHTNGIPNSGIVYIYEKNATSIPEPSTFLLIGLGLLVLALKRCKGIKTILLIFSVWIFLSTNTYAITYEWDSQVIKEDVTNFAQYHSMDALQDRVGVAYFDHRGDKYLHYAEKIGNGTWTDFIVDTVLSNANGYSPSVRFNPITGTPQIAYTRIDQSGQTPLTEVKFAEYNGLTWNIQTLRTFGGTLHLGQMTLDYNPVNGLPGIAFPSADPAYNSNLSGFIEYDGSSWQEGGVPDRVFNQATMKYASNGDVVIASSEDNIQIIKRENGVWDTSVIETLNSGLSNADYRHIGLSFDKNNNLSVAYQGSYQNLKYATFAGGNWSIDDLNVLSQRVDLLLNDADDPLIIFQGIYAGEPGMHLATLDSGTWNYQSIDSLGIIPSNFIIQTDGKIQGSYFGQNPLTGRLDLIYVEGNPIRSRVVPEPSTMFLMLSGLLGLFFIKRTPCVNRTPSAREG